MNQSLEESNLHVRIGSAHLGNMPWPVFCCIVIHLVYELQSGTILRRMLLGCCLFQQPREQLHR